MKEHYRAVDVVLVPPDEVCELAIDLSKQLKRSTFELGRTQFVPHLSLLMGYTRDLQLVKRQIQVALVGQMPLDLVAKGVEGTIGPHIQIEKHNELTRLHRRLMDVVDLKNDGVKQEFYLEGKAGVKTTMWLASFKTSHSRKNYDPHITLGDGVLVGEAPNERFPVEFEAKNVSLFHLGNYNTCRKLLASWELGK